MKRVLTIKFKSLGPVLIVDRSLYENSGRVVTLKDPLTGLPYIPAGVIIKALKSGAQVLSERFNGIEAKLDEALKMLHVSDCMPFGVIERDDVSASMGGLLSDDVFEGLTEKLDIWYKGKRIKSVVAKRDLTFSCDVMASGEIKEELLAALVLSALNIKTLGIKASDGLGIVEPQVNARLDAAKAAKILGG